MWVFTGEIDAGTDKAAAKATAGVPPAIYCASQRVSPASTYTAVAEASTGVPPAIHCAFQHIFTARRENTPFKFENSVPVP